MKFWIIKVSYPIQIRSLIQPLFMHCCLYLYCVGMVAYSRYTFNLDDIWMWLEIYYMVCLFLMAGIHELEDFPFCFAGFKYIGAMDKKSIRIFHFQCVYCAMRGLLLWQISRLICGEAYKWLRVFALGLILFHPGFATIMLGICYPERMQILFLLLFVWASMKFAATDKSRYAWIGFISATIALYYKEPTFLFIGFFGVFGVVVHYIRHKQLHIHYASFSV